MSQLLCIPLKRSLKLDLKSGLSNLINDNFYQVASVFGSDLETIDKMRDAALESDVSPGAVETLQNYYIQLVQLEKKFPDNQLSFKWFETLGLKSYGREDSRFAFEKLNIVYNIGALCSLLAADFNNGTAEGLKKACIFSQKSAGCFSFIAKELEGMDDPIMEKKAIHCLEHLMLAQAQELFWQKAIKDGLKNSIIARLAFQVSLYYKTSYKQASSSQLIRSDWEKLLKDKCSYFEAVTSFRYSLIFDEKGDYGSKVRTLRDASECLSHVSAQDETTELFRKKVSEASKTAERDNDLIYLQNVPTCIPPLKPAPMVKPIYFEGINGTPSQSDSRGLVAPLFKELLPNFVMQSSSAFSQRQEHYFQQYVVAPLNALNKLLFEKLPSYEIPGALHPISPEDLENCERSMNDLKLNSQHVGNILGQIYSLLSQESETDKLLRSKFGTMRWTIAPSEEINQDYWSKYHKIKTYLQEGESVDHDTNQQFDVIDKKLLTAPIKLPESNNPLVKEVSATLKRREDLILETENKSSRSTILPKIISAYKKTGQTEFEGLFAEHLKMFDEEINAVENEKHLNNKLIKKFEAQAEDDGEMQRLDARDIFVQDFKHSLKLFGDVKENIRGGSKFYNDLITSAGSLLTDVQQFEAERKEQKRKLEYALLELGHEESH
ncbi:LAQU0S01e04566g1_1 [Lachancea quebecensis]|uniref:LAQU0S01e04566g1_1 n=1 Tax=Lachancea quebecensis TaxID=1654605 RepID=A0A0P1KL49_9SACH|nr:LAQU0S01e04566g1_1 [Lachancea quebecensis]